MNPASPGVVQDVSELPIHLQTELPRGPKCSKRVACLLRRKNLPGLLTEPAESEQTAETERNGCLICFLVAFWLHRGHFLIMQTHFSIQLLPKTCPQKHGFTLDHLRTHDVREDESGNVGTHMDMNVHTTARIRDHPKQRSRHQQMSELLLACLL